MEGVRLERGAVVRRHGEAVREILLAALAALAYFGVRNLTAGSAETAFANADRIRRFEEAARLVFEDFGLFPAMLPAADVYERNGELVYELEVPGFEEKDLSIEITSVSGSSAASSDASRSRRPPTARS